MTADDAANNESANSNTASATTSAGGTPAKVIINEILANEPGSDTNREFVELVNVGGTSIDISGWSRLGLDGQVRHTFATGTTLAAGKAIVVFGGVGGHSRRAHQRGGAPPRARSTWATAATP